MNAAMLLSDAGRKPYTDTAYLNEELQSLTGYRFGKVNQLIVAVAFSHKCGYNFG